MTKFLFVVLLMGLSAVAQCQHEQSLVTVTGKGEVLAVPDQVDLVIGVENFAQDSSAARAENTTRLKRIIALLAAVDVDPKDYQSAGQIVSPRYKDDEESKKLLGYFARVEVRVKLRDLKKLADLNSRALAAGATTFRQAGYGTSELSKHRADARALAVKAAQEKAEFLAAQLGQKIGRAFRITEAEGSGLYGFTSNTFKYNEAEGSEGLGVIPVSERVVVSFELQ